MPFRFKLALSLALIAIPSPASAVIVAWYTATPLTPNATVGVQGSTGMPVALRCNKSDGDCSWGITARLWVINGTSTGYHLWLRDPAGNATNLSVSQTSVTGTPYSVANFIAENGPNGFVFEISASAPTSVRGSQTFAPQFMHSFVLTKTGSDLSGTTTLIAGSTFGFPGFEPPDEVFHQVAFAGNSLHRVEGDPYEWPTPVITITNTPEPGSAGLVAVGAVILGWRRKGSVRRSMRA